MAEPFISIVIPTWRQSAVLNQCLNSLARQNYPLNRYEIILVSSQKPVITGKINQKIKSILVGKIINHAEARNIGVAKAKGEIIAFCDDDCILPKNWLKKASYYFQNSQIDLIGGPAVPPKKAPLFYRLGGYLAGSRFAAGFGASRWQAIYPEQEANEFDLILANTFIRKKAFAKFGGFDCRQVPCEENFLYAKLKTNGHKLLYVPGIACTHPAKPIILPWAKKIFFYATGRGLLIARAPETFHWQYLIPSLFVFALILLAILSPFSLLAFSYLLSILIVYTFLNLYNAWLIFIRIESNPLVLILAPVTTFINHTAYGLGFLNGLVRYFTGRREAVRMPSKC